MTQSTLFSTPKVLTFRERLQAEIFDTRRESHEAIKPSKAHLQKLVLDLLKNEGPRTADECATRLNVDRLAIRPRLSELSLSGCVSATSDRRRNDSGKYAIVWEVVPACLGPWHDSSCTQVSRFDEGRSFSDPDLEKGREDI